MVKLFLLIGITKNRSSIYYEFNFYPSDYGALRRLRWIFLIFPNQVGTPHEMYILVARGTASSTDSMILVYPFPAALTRGMSFNSVNEPKCAFNSSTRSR